MLFSLSQTFLFSLNELVVLKLCFLRGVSQTLWGVWQVLWTPFPRKCMFTPNHIRFQRAQDLLKLLVCELQKETLSDDCGLLSEGPFPTFPLTPGPSLRPACRGALPED